MCFYATCAGQRGLCQEARLPAECPFGAPLRSWPLAVRQMEGPLGTVP